jgi:hypothetical protein
LTGPAWECSIAAKSKDAAHLFWLQNAMPCGERGDADAMDEVSGHKLVK